MLDIHFVREAPDAVRKNLFKRKDNEKLKWLDDLLEKDKRYRELLQEAQVLRGKRNELTQQITLLKSQKKDAAAKIKEAKLLPEKISKIEAESGALQEKISYYLMRLPNILLPSVPDGKDSSENTELKRWGKPIKHNFPLKPHGEFLQENGLADFDRAAKVSGQGFYFLLGDVALLDQAIIQFAIQHIVKKGYTFVEPPLMVRKEAYEGVTDLDDFEKVMYKIEGSDLYLIATSEHAIGAMFRDEIIDESQLPLKYAGLSACFRKEIGAHGIDTKGLFRVHQFNKVEQFIYCKPEESEALHEELLKNAEEVFQALAIPYRVVNICVGDIGTVAAKKYDLEAWMPREETYKEVVSCSNCTTYQAVRSNVKMRRKSGEKEFPHTLNSTAVATSRAIRAIIENFQEEDGTVKIPKVLHPFMHGVKEIKPLKRAKGK
ncbi:MAG: serine--tRNA ligase [Candidatus Diapherotrites archaeon]